MKAYKTHVIETEKFKTILFGILIRTKLSKSTVTKNSLIANVLKRGSEMYPSQLAIATKAEELYGAYLDIGVVKKGEEQIIQLTLEFPDERYVPIKLLEEGIMFALELIQNPKIDIDGFDKDNVVSAKKEVRQIIESKINDKKAYAVERCIEETFKDEAFSIPADGYADEIDGITAKDLLQHYKSLLEDAPIEIFATGNVSNKEINKIVEGHIGVKSDDKYKIENTVIKAPTESIHKIVEEKNVEQGKLCVCQTTEIMPTGDDYYSLLIANAILGGSATSMLFQQLREKESLCYYVNSIVYRFKSVILIQGGIDEQNTENVVNEIHNLNRALIAGNFSDEELQSAKKGLINTFKSMKDNLGLLTDYNFTSYLLNDKTTLDETIDKLSKVTAKDVMQVSKNIRTHTIYLLKGYVA